MTTVEHVSDDKPAVNIVIINTNNYCIATLNAVYVFVLLTCWKSCIVYFTQGMTRPTVFYLYI